MSRVICTGYRDGWNARVSGGRLCPCLRAREGRGQLVLLRVRIVLRHSTFGCVLLFSRIGIELKPLARCGEFKAASVRIVSRLGIPWRELEALGIRIVPLRRRARRGHQRDEQYSQYQHERDPSAPPHSRDVRSAGRFARHSTDELHGTGAPCGVIALESGPLRSTPRDGQKPPISAFALRAVRSCRPSFHSCRSKMGVARLLCHW